MDRRSFILAAAAAPVALRASPRSFVTADLESHVAVVDLAAARVVRRIPTPAGPRSIERVGEDYVVAHTAIGKVSILGVEVLDEFDEPRYTAGSHDGRVRVHHRCRQCARRDGRRPTRACGRPPQAEAVATASVALADGAVLRVALSSASPELAVVDVRKAAASASRPL